MNEAPIRPKVLLSANAFILLMRVRKALHHAGLSKHDMDSFAAQCGQVVIIQTPTDWTPLHVYQRLRRVAEELCELCAPAPIGRPPSRPAVEAP